LVCNTKLQILHKIQNLINNYLILICKQLISYTMILFTISKYLHFLLLYQLNYFILTEKYLFCIVYNTIVVQEK